MKGIHINQAESYSQEAFLCASCNREYEAKVITWVDASRTPQVKQTLLRWEFNMIVCTHCGCRQQAETPFFYEDFEEGLLLAVFPRIPESRGSVEASIQAKYGYYPILEFFYDMTQLWTLLYLQEHYRANKNLRGLSRLGTGEGWTRKVLHFLKEDPLMIDIRERLTESFFGDATEDQLMDLLARAIYKLEDMLPWPQDRRCLCGADLSGELKCCGKQVDLKEHDRLLSRQYVIYCASCGEALAGVSCEKCGRVYTWKLGLVRSYRKDRPQDQRVMDRPAISRNYPQFD
ncbi:MAG: CpXC domain-containing protein [Nitrospirota bacterium]|nr:CpXC domain-containing protein [Nitrospirota bacterium]